MPSKKIAVAPEQLEAFRRECAEQQRRLELSEECVQLNLERHAADLELVCACLAKDAAAWQILCEELLSPAAIRSALNGASAELVAEVQQGTAMLLRRTPSPLCGYRGVSPLRSWLRVLIRRVGITHWRRENREQRGREAFAAHVAALGPRTWRPVQDAEKDLFQRDLVHRLRGDADLLPRERQALALHHGGRTLQEIAEILALRDHNQAYRILTQARAKVELACHGISLRSLFSSPRVFLSLLFAGSSATNDDGT